jgi:hypothetical protein
MKLHVWEHVFFRASLDGVAENVISESPVVLPGASISILTEVLGSRSIPVVACHLEYYPQIITFNYYQIWENVSVNSA